MLGIDANIIVRYLTGDHPEQAARARTLVDNSQVFVPTTVLLETEWVLRSVYGIKGVALVQAIRAFAGLPQVTVEDPAPAAKALAWTEGGMDFADALHLAKSEACDAFVTFDGSFARKARRLGRLEVRKL